MIFTVRHSGEPPKRGKKEWKRKKEKRKKVIGFLFGNVI